MFRPVIRRISFIGRLGSTKVLSHVIETSYDAVYYVEDNRLWVIGFTQWPKIALENGRMVNSYVAFKPIVRLPNGDLQQGSVYHSKCTKPTKMYDISSHSIQLYQVDMNAEDLTIMMFDMRHFDQHASTEVVLNISKRSCLAFGLRVNRLNCVVRGQGKIMTKVQLPTSSSEPPRWSRWCLESLRITLYNQAFVEGIRINVYLHVLIPKPNLTRVKCDLIAYNSCMVSTSFTQKISDHIMIKRVVSEDFITHPPEPVVIPDSPDHYDDAILNQAVAASNDTLIEETYSAKKKGHFSMTSQVSELSQNIVIKNDRDKPCVGCQHHRAVFCASPCGCAFSCFTCMPLFQETCRACPLCRKPIDSAIFSTAIYNLPREAFPLSGPPASDQPLINETQPPCLLCKAKVAQVMLSCGHKVSCLMCTHIIQDKPYPACPFPGCNRVIECAIVVPSEAVV